MRRMKVYLDNGATTQTAPEAVKEMKKAFSKTYGNASSLHTYGQNAKELLENARAEIAKKINAEPGEIVFTSGGTESDNLAIKGAAYAKGTGHIIISSVEHPAVLNTCKQLQKEGYGLTIIPVDSSGVIDLKKLENAIKTDTILVSVMHANNEIGTIQPIKEIGKLCADKGVLFHTDAVQSFTKTHIDVKAQNVSLLSLSGHKIHGPKGVGVLYVQKGIKLKKLFEGGSHEHNLRAGTENVPGAVGMAIASKLVVEKDIAKMKKLRDYLIKKLLKIPKTRLNGHPEKRLCNNANISFELIEGESVLLQLDAMNIAVSTGSACSSHSLEPSHVLTAIGLPPEKSHGSIRFTLSKYTTKEEIDYTIKSVKKVVENLRKISALR